MKMAELFEKFGEFDSYIEINEAAKGLLQEGDTEGLRDLAKENGLEEEVEWYLNGETEELCDALSAALGKLKVERRGKNSRFYDSVADYLMAYCDDVNFARAVRKKGRRLEKAARQIWDEALRNTDIVEGQTCHYCDPMKGYMLLREYYIGDDGK